MMFKQSFFDPVSLPGRVFALNCPGGKVMKAKIGPIALAVMAMLVFALVQPTGSALSANQHPVDLNVSGHRQHGVFSAENWPVQTNG